MTLAAFLALGLAACGGKEKAAEGGAEKATAEGGEKVPGEAGAVLNLEPFVVNLADAGGGRYVKCTFKLALTDKKSLDSIQSDEAGIPKIRDKILTLLSSRTSDALMTTQGKDLLKREVQSRVNPVLRAGKVQDVYITEFLVQ
jgi:flagellar FliL protein